MIRTTLLRGAWLMLGAAIGLAAALLTGTIIGLGTQGSAAEGLGRPAIWDGALGAVVTAALIGMLPGVREIHVTAARTLLKVRAPVVVPEPMHARHRAATVLWTVFQTTAGLLSGFCLFGLAPGGVLTLTWTMLGHDDLVATLGWDYPAWQLALIGLGLLTAAATGLIASGWAAVRLAPVLLGPSAADRLMLAEARLAEERRHTALARELHDGIGHALSIISIQAAAAQRVVGAQPERAEAALDVIQQTSRDAQDELDHLLGLLRDPDAAPVRGPVRRAASEDLAGLIARHRSAGLTIEVRDTHSAVPPLIWDTTLDILAEALTNAHRHAGDAPVTVTVEQTAGVLELRVSNPLPAEDRTSRSTHAGRGIAGMQERAAILDGTVTAGPADVRNATGKGRAWHVTATIPVPPAVPPRRAERP